MRFCNRIAIIIHADSQQKNQCVVLHTIYLWKFFWFEVHCLSCYVYFSCYSLDIRPKTTWTLQNWHAINGYLCVIYMGVDYDNYQHHTKCHIESSSTDDIHNIIFTFHSAITIKNNSNGCCTRIRHTICLSPHETRGNWCATYLVAFIHPYGKKYRQHRRSTLHRNEGTRWDH